MTQGRTPEVVGLFGRDDARDRLASAVAGAAAGSGRTVWVHGEAGIGKTRLLAEGARLAEEAGFRVLRAAGWDDPGTPPLWLWTQVVRQVAGDASMGELEGRWKPRSARAVRLLLDPAAAPGTDAGPGRDAAPDHADVGAGRGDAVGARFRLFDAVGGIIVELTDERPVALVLDDLHWADPGSLELLRFLVPTVERSRLLVLCGWRDHEVAPTSEVAEPAGAVSARAERIGLDGLAPRDVARLVRETTRTELDDATARDVAVRTGGNPLFVTELARLMADRGPQAGLRSVPGTAQAIITRRLARVSQSCHDLLAVAAVAGTATGLDGLARLRHQDAARLTDDLDEALAAGLAVPALGRLQISHPLVREAILAAQPPSRLRVLHLAVADLLLPDVDLDPSTTAAVAHHLLEALPLADAALAAEMAARAGAAAHRAQAYEEAAAHYATSLELLPAQGPERFAALLGRGEALLAFGALDAARTAFVAAADLARGSGDAEGLARAALGFAAGLAGFEVRLWDQGQLDLLEEALDLLPPDDSPLRVAITARLSVATSFGPDESRRADLARQAVEMARRLGEPRSVAAALAAQCDAIAGPEHAEVREQLATEVVDLARGVTDHELVLLGLRLRVVARLERGDMAGARADVREFGRIAEQVRQPLFSWFVPLWQGFFALVDGDLDTLDACAAEVARIGELADSRNAATLSFVQRIWSETERGRLLELVPDLAAVRDAMPEIAPDGSDALLFLFPGQPAHVRQRVLDVLPSVLAAVHRDAEYVSNLCHMASALFEADDDAAYASLVHALLVPHAHRFGIDGIAAGTHGSVERLLGAMSAQMHAYAAAEEHFERAVAANAGQTLEVAKTRLMWATMLYRRGDPSERERLESMATEVVATYRALGYPERVDPALLALADGAAPADGRSGEPGPPAEAAELTRTGEFWQVRFRGASATVRDVKGIGDLVVLLRHPGHEVHVLDLVGRAAGPATAGPATAGRGPAGPGAAATHDGSGGGSPGDLGPVLDDRARAAYRERLRVLELRIEEAEAVGDLGDAEQAAQEKDVLVAELSAAYGLGGRVRRAGDPVERARTTVTWRIRDAIRRLAAVHPELGRHLSASVRTGTYCSYAPEVPQTWRL